MARHRKSLGLLLSILVLGTLLAGAQVALGRRASEDTAIPPRLARWLDARDAPDLRTQLRALPSREDRPAAIRDLLRAAAAEVRGEEAVQIQAGTTSWRALGPAGGDLDGDGKEDAFEYTATGIRGVRGTDGAALWSRSFVEWGELLRVGPLDGVAGDDLMIMEVVESGTAATYRWDISYRGLSGKTGAVLWSRTYQNNFGGEWTPVGGVYVDLDFALPRDSGDLSGDGKLDLVVDRSHYMEADAGPEWRSSSSTVYEVISGAAGSVAASFPATGGEGWNSPAMTVVPDLTSDGAPDVVVASSTSNEDPVGRVLLQAYPGKGGAPVWSRVLTRSETPWLEAAEVNGDGRGDVIAYSWSDPTLVLSGATGADLWTTPDGAWLEPVGDANADGGQDLMMIRRASAGTAEAQGTDLAVPDLPGHELRSHYGGCYGFRCGYPSCVEGAPEPPDYGYGYGYGYGYEPCQPNEVRLLNGKTGATLWSRVGLENESFELLGESTGDGIGDVLTLRYEYANGLGATNYGVISGRDGTTRWARRDPGLAYIHDPLGNLDGAGGSDLIRVDMPASGTDRILAIRGTDGGPMWPAVRNTNAYLSGLDGARLRGAASDLLESRGEPDGTFGALARSGANGAQLWIR